MTILTVTAPRPYKRKGETEASWFFMTFALFGKLAHALESQFKEGDLATVWYDLDVPPGLKHANHNVRSFVIHPNDKWPDAPRTAPKAAEAATPLRDVPPRETPFRAAKARTETDDDHPPF